MSCLQNSAISREYNGELGSTGLHHDYVHMARILVVDDEPFIRTLLHRVLTRDGFQVDVASDGPEALRIATQNPPDLLLTDVDMPLMNGPALAAQIQQDWPHTTVLFISGSCSQCLHEAGIHRMSNQFLSKPFSNRELLGRIQNLLAI